MCGLPAQLAWQRQATWARRGLQVCVRHRPRRSPARRPSPSGRLPRTRSLMVGAGGGGGRPGPLACVYLLATFPWRPMSGACGCENSTSQGPCGAVRGRGGATLATSPQAHRTPLVRQQLGRCVLGAEATRTRERGMGDEDRGVGGTTLWGWSPPAWSCPPCRTTIWSHRVRFLEERALPHWATFTIWNAGRQGRRLYRSLTPGARAKVRLGPHPPPCSPAPRPHPPPAPTALSPRLTSEADLQVLPRWSRSVTWTRKRSRRASTATRIPRCVARSGDLVPKGSHPQDAILGPGCDAAQDLPPGKATGATCLPAPESGTIRDAKVAGWGDRCRIQPQAAVTGPRASAAGVRVARPP